MKEYNIGLDIGTNSVGWAVTDINDRLLKLKGRYLWGVRRFSTAETAAQRRLYRSTRRRIERRKERINLLQELLQKDVLKEDSSFFIKLSESYKCKEDSSFERENIAAKCLYNRPKYLDYNLIKDYPTIYHLRQALYNSKEKMDIRLIYLAMHHMLKYRGNFLYEGQNFNNDTNLIEENLIELINLFNQITDSELDNESYAKSLLEVLKDNKIRRADKKDKIINILGTTSDIKKVSTNITNAILGYSVDFSKIFDLDEQVKFKISDDIDDDKLSKLGEYAEKLELLNSIYSWVALQDILNDSSNISEAFVKKYNKYASDLKILKKLYNKYSKDKYKYMFKVVAKKGDKNFSAYNENYIDLEGFYKIIKNDLDKVAKDSKEYQYILVEMENLSFLRRLNVVENSAIPYQLHKEELNRIIKNQSKYYDTLKENGDKIISILEFKIPYYVGPLSKDKNKKDDEQFAWIEKIKDEKVLPWNFDEVVDTVKSAEKFITRMTNKCTYLLGEDVIPKNSLLYSEFCLLQELNKFSVNNRRIDKETKSILIENLFKKVKNVKEDRFKKFLIENKIYNEIQKLEGYQKDKEFASSLTSYIDFKSILGKVDISNYNMIENIIRWITLFEDKKILKIKVKKEYGNILTEEQIKRICKLKYKGWSSLSEKLILGLKSQNTNESIIEILRKTDKNFMQILKDKEYGFEKQVEESYPNETITKIDYSEIEKLHGSPALKRGIWQTTKIVEELVEILGEEPKNIYIEFAREDGEKIRTKSRTKQIDNLYKNFKKNYKDIYNNLELENVYKEFKKITSEKTNLSDEEFLYFIQNGKSLYSMKSLDLETLSQDCDIDHIIPRSIVKDDSLSNKALVLGSENKEKSDRVCLSIETIKKCRPWWEALYKANLIDNKKFYNLIKTEYTQEDKEKFINRQLVETRQITKHIANLFIRRFKNTKVNSVKANLTSSFRDKYDFPKDREINNFHHAHDAYFATLIGNLIIHKFKNGEDELDFSSYVSKYKSKGEKYGIGVGIFKNSFEKEDGYKWDCLEKIEYLKNILSNKHAKCYVTYKLEELTGMFYKETLQPKNKNLIPINRTLDPKKYGGYTNIKTAYFVLISFNLKEKNNYELIPIPVQNALMIKNNKLNVIEYIKSIKPKYENIKILKSKILINSKFILDNDSFYTISGAHEWTNAKELILDYHIYKLICLLKTQNKSYKELCYKLNDLKEIENKLYNIEKSTIEERKIFVNNSFDKISLIIYDELLNKMNQEYVKLDTTYQKLLENREEFISKDLLNKIKIINEILKTLGGKQGNLKELGLGDRVGRISGKNINNSNINKITFIDESVTGIYERRYKASELENGYNN